MIRERNALNAERGCLLRAGGWWLGASHKFSTKLAHGSEPRAASPEPTVVFHRKGVTLLELLLVLVIITVLAAMALPRLVGRRQQAEVARAKSDIAAISLALDLYELDMGGYPETLEELVAKEAPSSLSQEAREKWNGPYLKKGLPKDPWGRPYEYKNESQHNQDYDLSSLGPDGQAGNDDIVSWE